MYCCWSWHGRNCRLVFLKVEGWYVSKTTCLMWEKIVLDLKVWFNSNCWADLYNASHPSWSFYPKIYTPAAWKMMQKWRCIFLQRMGIFHEGIMGFFGVHRCSYVPTVVFFSEISSPLQPGIDSSMRAAFVSWSEVGLLGKFHSACHLDDKKNDPKKERKGKVDQEISFRGLSTVYLPSCWC